MVDLDVEWKEGVDSCSSSEEYSSSVNVRAIRCS